MGKEFTCHVTNDNPRSPWRPLVLNHVHLNDLDGVHPRWRFFADLTLDREEYFREVAFEAATLLDSLRIRRPADRETEIWARQQAARLVTLRFLDEATARMRRRILPILPVAGVSQ